MRELITVVTVRPTYFRGQPVLPGTRLDLSELDAHALVTNGKARLVESHDGARTTQAVQLADCWAISQDAGFLPTVQRVG